MRGFLILLVLLALVSGGAVYYRYETLDPCMMLAQEEARIAQEKTGGLFGLSDLGGDAMDDVLQTTFETINTQYTKMECTEILFDGVKDKVSEMLP